MGPTEPSKRQSDKQSGLQSNNQTYRLMASTSKYSLLIMVWFSPLVARLLSIQSCSKSCKSADCFGASRRPSASCIGPAFFVKNSAEPAALLCKSHLTATILVSTASKPGFNLSRTVASSPQRKGDIVH